MLCWERRSAMPVLEGMLRFEEKRDSEMKLQSRRTISIRPLASGCSLPSQTCVDITRHWGPVASLRTNRN
jgi:hypothetical protein